MVKVRINDLKISTVIGVHGYERETKQTISIDIEIEYDADKAIRTDDLSDTLDYEKICDSIATKMQSCRFCLIESVAGYVLDIIMKDQQIQKSIVKVTKTNAVTDAKSVEVEVSRSR